MRLPGWIGAGFMATIAACAFGSQTTDDDASPQNDATTKDAPNSDAGQAICNGIPTDTKSDKTGLWGLLGLLGLAGLAKRKEHTHTETTAGSARPSSRRPTGSRSRRPSTSPHECSSPSLF